MVGNFPAGQSALRVPMGRIAAAIPVAAFKLNEAQMEEPAVPAVGLSHAEMCRVCADSAKMVVLDDRRTFAVPDLPRSIQLRQERRRARHRLKADARALLVGA
jgi:hypothetical protein